MHLSSECRAKKNTSYRLIVHLSQLNIHCPCSSFQSEDLNSVLLVSQPGEHLITLDIKNGFHLSTVQEQNQTYLTFRWRSVYYVWQMLLFELAVSAYFFP